MAGVVRMSYCYAGRRAVLNKMFIFPAEHVSCSILVYGIGIYQEVPQTYDVLHLPRFHVAII